MNDLTHHALKCESKYFQLVLRGKKKFEVRKNDRNYKVGDTIVLSEVKDGELTGHHIGKFSINYIIKDSEAAKYGLRKGYCIFNW